MKKDIFTFEACRDELGGFVGERGNQEEEKQGLS